MSSGRPNAGFPARVLLGAVFLAAASGVASAGGVPECSSPKHKAPDRFDKCGGGQPGHIATKSGGWMGAPSNAGLAWRTEASDSKSLIKTSGCKKLSVICVDSKSGRAN